MPEEQILTGISEFDKVCGGFVRKGNYIVSGAADTGKSIFSIQFLRNGLLNEEKGILVTEREPHEYLDLARQINLPLDTYVENNDLVIIKQVTLSSGIVSDENEFTTFMTDLGNLIVPVEATRIVFDSFIPIIQLFTSEYLEQGIRALFFEIKQMGLTALLTTKMPTSRNTLAIKRFIEDQVNGSIHLDEHTKENSETSRKLVVRKMTGLTSPFPVFNFTIEPDTGINILEQSETGLIVAEKTLTKPKPKEIVNGFSFANTYQAANVRQEMISKPEPKPEAVAATAAARKLSFKNQYAAPEQTKEKQSTPEKPRFTNIVPKEESESKADLETGKDQKVKEKAKISFTDYEGKKGSS